MAETLIVDIETDGTYPSVIHMVGVLDYHSDKFDAYVGDDVPLGILRIMDADTIIGHHIEGYDLKHMTRLTEGLADFSQQRVIDTLKMSRRLCNLDKHGLAAWGEMFGFPKLPSPPWDRYTPEMKPYCERDCRINKLVADFLFDLDGFRV